MPTPVVRGEVKTSGLYLRKYMNLYLYLILGQVREQTNLMRICITISSYSYIGVPQSVPPLCILPHPLRAQTLLKKYYTMPPTNISVLVVNPKVSHPLVQD